MTESKSLMFSPATLVAMLMEAEKNGFPMDEWNTVNDNQKWLMELMPIYHDQITKGNIPEMKSILAKSSAELENFLKENGVQMQIPQFEYPSQVGIAGLMGIKMEWPETASAVTIRMGKTREEIESEAHIVDGVRLGTDVSHFRIGMNQFVTSIKTKTGDKIYVAEVDEAPKDIFSLVLEINRLSLATSGKYYSRFGGIAFPMVSVEEQIELDWLQGFQFGKGSSIDFATQKNELAIDEFGAIVRSATVGGMMIGISTPPLVIRGSFLIWVERNGVTIFYGYIAEDGWKRPSKTTK